MDDTTPSSASPTIPIRNTAKERSPVHAADVLKVLALTAVFVAGCLLLLQLAPFFLTLAIAALLAIAADPAVRFFQRRGLKRGPAVGAFTVCLIAVIVLMAAAFVPPLIDQGQVLADEAPGYVDQLREQPVVGDLEERYGLIDRARDAAQKLPERIGGGLASAAGALFAGIAGALTVLFLMIFLLLGGRDLMNGIVRIFPQLSERRWWSLVQDSYRSISGYVAGTLLVALIAGLTILAASLALGLPGYLPLALWMALFDIVPLVGALIGAAPAVVVAFAAGGMVDGIVMLVIVIVYQQLENIVIQPAILGKVVALAPILVFIAILAGSQLLGIVGALLAIPVAGVIQIFLHAWLEGRSGRELKPPPVAPSAAPDAPTS